MKRSMRYILWSLALLAGACMEYGPQSEEAFSRSGRGIFITCEGNFMWDNASLSYYDPETRKVENDIFLRANGMKLGDVAQSMTLHDGKGYVVVNNSGVIYVIDPSTFRITGLIEEVVSPRYIHFVDGQTAYVTDLYDPRISVVDTRTNRIRTRIDMNGHRSTEQMVQVGNRLFVNCWSYDNKILVVDTQTERLVDSLTVGWQPNSLLLDGNGKLWTATDGRDGEAPALWRIDPATLEIERWFELPADTPPSKLTLDARNNRIYFIARDVWRIEADAESLPATPFLPYAGTLYYGLGVDPDTAELYVADAIDYVQHAAVYRFSPDGQAVDTLRVGIIPGSFCFKRQ
ncbi:YncE family protein [uncultured Alistipes sp.]|uniref:YncE family protein n=1 Tax=uncultured Alistipes sp. TaxID=538949 RepID=UPI003208FC75